MCSSDNRTLAGRMGLDPASPTSGATCPFDRDDDPTMTNLSGPTPSSPSSTAKPIRRKNWQYGVAPAYIGLFLWLVFFDRLARTTLAVGGVVPSVLGAVAGGVLCTVLLYRVPATWGFRAGQPPIALTASTFGVTGSRWVNGLLIGPAQVVWLAVATYYATELTFEGLASCRLLDLRSLRPIPIPGLGLPSLLFLVTSLAWCYAAAMVGHYLVRIIGALMTIYPAFMAVLLAAAVLSTIRGVPAFRPLEIDPVTARPSPESGFRAFAQMIELVFGFFATAGVMAADWGAASQTERDVRVGGWVGVAFACATVTTLALLVVAGAHGLTPIPLEQPSGSGRILDPWTFRAAVIQGVGAPLAGLIFLVFGLGSLAPSCYAAYNLGRRLEAAWPRVKSLHAVLAGTAAAWVFIVLGWAEELETIFAVMGAVFGPLAGAIAADYVFHRGAWPGARQGLNRAGLFAWAAGLAVGLVPLASRATRWSAGDRFQPAAVFAFLASFLVYLILASLGSGPPSEPVVPPDLAANEQPAPGGEADNLARLP
jgi:cytosine permease